MKRAKRYLSTMLVTATAVTTVLTGCGGGSGNGGGGKSSVSTNGGLPELTADRYELDASTPAWQLDKKTDTTELTWYVNADWWNTDWGNDTVTKKIKEDLNLDVQFITGDDTKLNTFFAGGKKPDIITVFDASSSVAQSAEKWAWSLNDLADKYDPYFYEVASKDSLNWFKLSDGKTYGYPDYSNGQDVYDSGLLKATTAFTIRKDVYEALGEPEMGTPEQFLSVLREIKEKYPDLIPFGSNSMTDSTGSLGADLQNFLGVPIENEDGTWYDRNMDEDYLSWIKTLSAAYREGLISDDNFSDDGTAHEDKVKTGKYACLFIGGTRGEGKLKSQFIIENISPDQGSAEARAKSAIDTNWNTTLTSLIRSGSDEDFDAVLAEHVAFRASNNWDDIVKIYNEKMSANREKLGK